MLKKCTPKIYINGKWRTCPAYIGYIISVPDGSLLTNNYKPTAFKTSQDEFFVLADGGDGEVLACACLPYGTYIEKDMSKNIVFDISG